MKRLLLATIVAVVVATPISVAWGSDSSSPSTPAAKTEYSQPGAAGGATAPKAYSGPHGDGQCPFAETPAI